MVISSGLSERSGLRIYMSARFLIVWEREGRGDKGPTLAYSLDTIFLTYMIISCVFLLSCAKTLEKDLERKSSILHFISKLELTITEWAPLRKHNKPFKSRKNKLCPLLG